MGVNGCKLQWSNSLLNVHLTNEVEGRSNGDVTSGSIPVYYVGGSPGTAPPIAMRGDPTSDATPLGQYQGKS